MPHNFGSTKKRTDIGIGIKDVRFCGRYVSHNQFFSSVPPSPLFFDLPSSLFCIVLLSLSRLTASSKNKGLISICITQRCGSKLPNDLFTTCFHEIQKRNRIPNYSTNYIFWQMTQRLVIDSPHVFTNIFKTFFTTSIHEIECCFIYIDIRIDKQSQFHKKNPPNLSNL